MTRLNLDEIEQLTVTALTSCGASSPRAARLQYVNHTDGTDANHVCQPALRIRMLTNTRLAS